MLTININDSAFRAHMDRLQKSLGDMGPVMDAIGSKLENNVRNRFASRTDPNGNAWTPWRPATVESYPFTGRAAAKDGPGNARLLDRYGTMLEGLNYQADTSSARIGFAQPYAAFHEFGTKRMDRRGMLMSDPTQGTLGAQDEADVLDILEAWLSDLAA